MLILLINRTEKKRNIENISLRVNSSCGYGTGTYVVDEQTSDSLDTTRHLEFRISNVKKFLTCIWFGVVRTYLRRWFTYQRKVCK